MGQKKPKKLWILEDDGELRSILAYVGHTKGFEVSEFATLDAASKALESAIHSGRQEFPDGIVSDLELPDGLSVPWMLQARQAFVECRIVCYSGSLDHPLEGDLTRRAIRILHKPSTLREVFLLIEE